MSVVLVMLVFLLPMVVCLPDEDSCPDKCTCNGTTDIVTCCNAQYTDVPRLPTYTRELIFTGNNLGNVSSQTFKNIDTLHITYLKLDACSITSVSSDAFEYLLSLESLDLSRNNFCEIVDQVFTAVLKTHITYFTLSSANLTSLPNESAICPTTLRNLDIGNNRIQYLNTENLRNGCPSVENLTLSGNYLQEFNFTSIPEKVVSLQMHTTKLCGGIPELCKNNKTILPLLSYLDLSHNAFQSLFIFKEQGHCLPKLRTLILDGNAYVSSIYTLAFSTLKMLRNVSLRQMTLPIKLFADKFGLTTLESLQLQTTDIAIVRNQPGVYRLFQNCRNLTSLSLQNINLHGIDLSMVFLSLVNLKKLEIIDSGLTNISFVGKLPNLSQLILRKNYISYWEPNTFMHNTHIEFIDLSRNHIAMLSKRDFPIAIWNRTPHIDLHGNPFECTYELCEFRHWVSNNIKKLIDYPEKYFCESPGNVKGTQLSSWLPTEEECRKPKTQNNKVVLMVSIIVGCVVLVGCIIGIIIYRKRWNIKHYIYLMRSRKGYESLPDGEAYIYDAFVAYHYTDRPWIVSHLLPYLESQKKLRLCLHERDFIPGNFIVDNILNNIESSRKVIVVLSNNFARSEWCQFEATTAYKRVVSNGVSSVVLILLEEISARNVNSVLGNLLQTMTYVDWTNQDAGRALFWSRLDDSLK